MAIKTITLLLARNYLTTYYQKNIDFSKASTIYIKLTKWHISNYYSTLIFKARREKSSTFKKKKIFIG